MLSMYHHTQKNIFSLPPSPPRSSPPSDCDSSVTPPPALSGSEIISLVCRFIRSDEFLRGSEDLIISPVDNNAWEIFCEEFENPLFLSGKEVDSLRYNYCPHTATLTIPHMPTPVHDAVNRFVHRLINEMIFSQFLSRNESRAISPDFGEDVLLPTSEDLPLGICKGVKGDGTAKKQADAAISFINEQNPEKSDRFPRVVFEVAFSQSYGTLLEDARHWLVGSSGYVKLVIAIFLQEGPRELGHNDPAESQQLQTASDQQEKLSEDPGPWVGPITGFIELYRYNSENRAMYQDGSRYEITPPAPSDGNSEEVLPRILITDLLPEDHIEGDKSRSFELPLGIYRFFIEAGRRRLAMNRRGGGKRKRKDSDGEYSIADREGGGTAQGGSIGQSRDVR